MSKLRLSHQKDHQSSRTTTPNGIPYPATVPYSALHKAAAEGDLATAEKLLKDGADVNAVDDMQLNTPLHEAAWKGRSQTVELLLKHQADPAAKNRSEFTALHLACQEGHNESCRKLLLGGAKPNARNTYGDTPLHTSCRYGHAGVARILISAYCNVNQPNKNHDTPLTISAAMGRRKLTKILLEAGCNPAIKNKQGDTAMDLALRKGFTEVQEIIANPPALKPRQSQSVTNLIAKCHFADHPKEPHSHCILQPANSQKRDKASNSHGSSCNISSSTKGKVSSKKKKPKYPVAVTVHPAPSPYGPPQNPDLSQFPQPKVSTFPTEPLRTGETFYMDLSGNIKKGPINKGIVRMADSREVKKI